jgi:hypothetical protein
MGRGCGLRVPNVPTVSALKRVDGKMSKLAIDSQNKRRWSNQMRSSFVEDQAVPGFVRDGTL